MGNPDRTSILEDSLSRTPLVPPTSYIVSYENWNTGGELDTSTLPEIEITAEKTQDALARFAGDHNVTVLNFASGVSPGGGVRYGARAQEEDLCLCSNLLTTLEDDKFTVPFYERNQEDDAPDACYDLMIVSKNVTFYRDGQYRLLEGGRGPALVHVITYPAPNMERLEAPPRAPSIVVEGIRFRMRGEGVQEPIQQWSPKHKAEYIFKKRCQHILDQASKLSTEILILGAWGCGAYGNDPTMVAESFKKAITQSRGTVKKIVFAIYGDKNNQNAFHKVFNV